MHGRWNLCWQDGRLRAASPTCKSCENARSKIVGVCREKLTSHDSSSCQNELFCCIYSVAWANLQADRASDSVAGGVDVVGDRDLDLGELLDRGLGHAVRASGFEDVQSLSEGRVHRIHLRIQNGSQILSALLEFEYKSAPRCEYITWLWTALCTVGSTFSRTSLPLKRLQIMSICVEELIYSVHRICRINPFLCVILGQEKQSSRRRECSKSRTRYFAREREMSPPPLTRPKLL